ncbi:amidohydrolase [Pseudonocardia alaniniphila]|uniref:Amidohydrolase family protein n=1 Tax=Pseudonocardia alaniniphila TaxID=75291 RepID=A0ABS9T9H2_9PSEU|nr:amidohydrolase family protein [Pseudonocardia alaniniphila]MCH6165068.1 amidohydrolase family protein [Pseudonocardia alaniniphila]
MSDHAGAGRGELVLRSARMGGRIVDITIEAGVVTAIGPELTASRDAEVVALDGRSVLPGLWDNHVHFDQWTLARKRLDLGSARSADEVVALVARRMRTDPPAQGAALVGAGFRDALWPDVPHRDLLDPVTGGTPVVLVSADLHCCWLNSAAARTYGWATHPTGVLRETDWHPIMEDTRKVPVTQLDVWAGEAAQAASARGVVGVVDFEAPFQLDAWAGRISRGCTALRVVSSVWPSHLDQAISRGLRTGDPIPGTAGLLTMGPLKVVSDGSLNTRTAYCQDPYPGLEATAHPCGVLLVAPEDLVPLLRKAAAAGIDAAVHAIGDKANTFALDAFAASGVRGRIEHAQLLSEPDVARFAELGVVASVQPEHAIDDRDVADRYWKGRTSRAFPYRSLRDAGAELVLGSDAPVAPLDPWVSIAAAVRRSADDRPSWHGEQEIPFDVALAASAGPDGPIRVGRRADMIVTEDVPAELDPLALRTLPVAGTMVGGRWTHRAGLGSP